MKGLLEFTFTTNDTGGLPDAFNPTGMDVFGIKLEEIQILQGQNQIQTNVSSYPPGIYIVVLKNAKSILARKKFVIIR